MMYQAAQEWQLVQREAAKAGPCDLMCFFNVPLAQHMLSSKFLEER